MAKKKALPRKVTATPPERDLTAILDDTLEQIMRDYYQGNRIQLFHAIIHCARYGIVLPPYIRHEVEEAFRRYTSGDAWSLEDAFDIHRPVRMHKEAERDRVTKAYRVYLEVERRRNNGDGLGPELYEHVGRSFNVSGSTARRYHKEVRRTLFPPK